jgi:hypothetical protein
VFEALTLASNPETAASHPETAASLNCFTLVDNSFLTNGVEVKLSLITAVQEHTCHPGLAEVYKAGYKVSFRRQTLSSLLDHGSGT